MIEAEQIIKYANMLNSEKLSTLRSGNVSLRYKNGFLITPSGVKYSLLSVINIQQYNLLKDIEFDIGKTLKIWFLLNFLKINKVLPNFSVLY